MFSRLTNRITYANVAATLALFLALSGGAYAASRILITSTKQISPKVLKALKGSSGAKGPIGATGAPGLQGPAGAPGSPGITGKEGAPGKEGATGKEGAPGKEGSPWTLGGTLPSKATEKGTWANVRTAAEHEVAGSAVSFTVPLAKSLDESHVHYIRAGENGVGSGCPTTSSAAKPEAEAGNLCVFAAKEENSQPLSFEEALLTIEDPEAETAEENFMNAGKSGVVILSEAKAAGETKATGTWAVTAP